MNYKILAKEILTNIGGKDNIKSFTHCATRLRFNLIDESKFNQDSLKKVSGVIGTVMSGGQSQVIIGTDVSHVYDELKLLIPDNNENLHKKDIIEEKSKISMILDTISGIFTPILPAITGASMIKVIVILLSMTGILKEGTQTYKILTFVGDTPFYFLPIMLSYSAAVKFKMNPMMGLVLGLMLIHPTYIDMVNIGDPVKLFKILPITLTKYTSTVIPIILIIWVASYVEKFADKISPKSVRFFLKPLITLLIMIPLAFVFVGPLGTIVGSWLESILNVMQIQVPWSLPIIFGILAPIFIMFGMHYVVTIPLVMTAININGFDMLGPGFLVSNMGQAGAALAISLLAKNVDFKAMSLSSGLTALLGVTEPAMYGVNLRLKKPFIAALIGGGTGGLICGLSGVKRIVFGPTGLTTLPIFIDPNNPMNIVFTIIGVIASFAMSFGITYYISKKDVKMMNEIS